MERHVRFVAYDPAIVARRPWRNVENRSGPQFINRAALHGSRRTSGKHHPNMLDVASCRADARPNVYRPPPSRLIGSPPNRHTSQANDFEFALFKRPHLIRLFKSLQQYFQICHVFSNALSIAATACLLPESLANRILTSSLLCPSEYQLRGRVYAHTGP